MRSGNQIIRDALKSAELDEQLQQLVFSSSLEEKDRNTVLSWIRAVRDECSAALRKAQDYQDLVSRMSEFQLRAGLFELLAIREPGRARKQKLQGELLAHLQSYIQELVQTGEESSELMGSLRKQMMALIPALNFADPVENPNGPLLVVETDYKQDRYQLSEDGTVLQETNLQSADSGEEDKDAHDSDSMATVATESSESPQTSDSDSADHELLKLRAENQELKQKLNDFLEEWGEGIRIDGKTVSILTHRKIIVKKSSREPSE
ncbi:MAG: hypothetical protein RH862_07315 [Leptospiraceae bacterium]